jgi:lysyl-tRNA synthetase class 2
MLAAIRDFLFSRGYVEIETPLRIPAPLPEAHIDPFPSGSWYLQPSPELCMKRLLAAGWDRIFQVAKCFRQKERGAWHLPEFTMLEWYRRGVDYTFLMEETEALINHVAASAGGPGKRIFHGKPVGLEHPWTRISVHEAFAAYANLSPEEALANDIFDEVLVSQVEPHLGTPHPTFLYDYPAALGSLARPKPGRPDLVERFELYLGGVEIANAFSELSCPKEQAKRFAKENELRFARGQNPYSGEKFLESLPQMGEAAGIALGIDRLVMFFTGADCIDEVVAFTPEEL